MNARSGVASLVGVLAASLAAAGPALAQPPIPAQVQAPAGALPPRPEISVRTDKGIYRAGERPRISGRMLFGVGNPATGFAKIKVYEKGKPGESDVIRYNNLAEARAGEFSDDGFIVQMPHREGFQFRTVQTRYLVQAVGITDAPSPPEAITEILAEEVGLGSFLLFFAVALGTLFYILGMVYFAFMGEPTRQAGRRMLLMIYLVALLFLVLPFLGPLFISFSSDLEAFLRTTPVGFLKSGKPEEAQWVINIGGVLSPGGTLKGGVAVPLLVLVLALLGAAINMLRRLPEFLRRYDAIPETGSKEKSSAGEELRSDLFRYFVYLLSAPFIGMVAYSLMVIADYTNPHAVSIVAFAVGFISDAVVERIMGTAQSILAGRGGRGEGDKGRKAPGKK